MKPLHLSLALSIAWSGFLQAEDRITLQDDSILHGTVRQIDDAGKIIVDSELSPKPLLLKGEALRSINFDVAHGEYKGHPELLHLVNGDILPGRIQALDDQQIQLDTWYAGLLTIPRKHARSISFGVAPQKLAYQGPKGLAGWSNNDANWEFEGGKLVCESTGTIAREKVLPEQFILRFRLEWENNPNFKFYFCDDFLKQTGDTDRYYFEINTGGMQLRRQTSKGERRWFGLAQDPRRPEDFRGRGVDVELRVDRKNRVIYLYIDNEKFGAFPDSIDDFPTGTGIMLHSQANGGLKNIVSRIEIFEWDAITELRRNEGHKDPKTDGVVDVDGQHFSGTAVRLEDDEGRPRLLFTSPFIPDLLKIHTHRLSSLYFKEPEEALGKKGRAPINFDLRGGGKLQLSSLALGEDVLSAKHPLLNDLNLKREALQQLFVTSVEEEDAPAENPEAAIE